MRATGGCICATRHRARRTRPRPRHRMAGLPCPAPVGHRQPLLPHHPALRARPQSRPTPVDQAETGIPGGVQAIREDRFVHEAHASGGDIRRICDLFGLSVTAAERYIDTIDHPDLIAKGQISLTIRDTRPAVTRAGTRTPPGSGARAGRNAVSETESRGGHQCEERSPGRS